jgi:hypothetical protein
LQQHCEPGRSPAATRRYRLHEAIARAADGPVDWATLAADLGYRDQAHLVRDFTATVGPAAAYARLTGAQIADRHGTSRAQP